MRDVVRGGRSFLLARDEDGERGYNEDADDYQDSRRFPLSRAPTLLMTIVWSILKAYDKGDFSHLTSLFDRHLLRAVAGRCYSGESALSTQRQAKGPF